MRLIESLESRRLFSIALNSSSWTAVGPAPISNGQTPGALSVSGRIYALAANPTNPSQIYSATAGGGIWRSNDAGSTFVPLSDSQPTLFTSSIAIAPSNPNVIYAGTGEPTLHPASYTGRGVLKSTDGGTTWTLVGSGNLNRMTISQVVVSSTDPNVVYAAVSQAGVNGGTATTGIYKSTNGGTSWTNTTAGISTSDSFTDLVIDPSNPNTLYCAVGTWYGAPANGVYKSTNGGTTWAPAGGFEMGRTNGWTRLAISASSPGVLYAAVAGSSVTGSTTAGTLYRVYRTGNSGATWSNLANTPDFLGGAGFFSSSIAVSPVDSDVVYAAGYTGNNSVIRSIDAGQSWTDINVGTNGAGPHLLHHGLLVDSSGNLFDANDGGAFKYTVSTNQWTSLNSTLNISQVNSIALDPSSADVAYSGAQDNGTNKYTGSLAWSQKRQNDGGVVRVDASTPNTVYHEYSFGSSFLQRSTDGGATWSTKTSGLTTSGTSNFYPPLVMDPSTSTRLVLGTDRVWLTTTRGDSWSAISTTGSNGWTSTEAIDALAVAKTAANTIYASAGGDVFVTTNGGTSWTIIDPVASPSTGLDYTDIVVDPTNSRIVYIVAADFSDVTGGAHIWKTTNGGTTWTNISGNLPDLPAWSLALDSNSSSTINDDVLYLGTDAGVYRSNNGGTTWTLFSTGLPTAQVRDLEYNASLNILAAGTYGRGMWEIQIDRSPLTADVVDVSPDPRITSVGSITITFNKPVLNFDLSDLSLKRDGSANLLTASQTLTTSDNITWTLSNVSGLTATPGEYVLSVSGSGGGISDASGNSLSASATDAFTVELSPAVSAFNFNDDIAPNTLTIQFTQNVQPSLSSADLLVTNRNGGAVQAMTLTGYNTATNTATFIFSGYSGSILPEGDYRAVLFGAGVNNVDGFVIQNDNTINFFHFAGDANHSRTIDATDFTLLANNYNLTGRTFSQGDFNYDGVVNLLDFNALATRFGTTFTAPANEPAVDEPPVDDSLTVSTPALVTPDLFSDKKIVLANDVSEAII